MVWNSSPIRYTNECEAFALLARRNRWTHTREEWLLILLLVSCRFTKGLLCLLCWLCGVKWNLVDSDPVGLVIEPPFRLMPLGDVTGVSPPVNGISDSSLISLVSLVRDICLFALMAKVSGVSEKIKNYDNYILMRHLSGRIWIGCFFPIF